MLILNMLFFENLVGQFEYLNLGERLMYVDILLQGLNILYWER